MRAPARAAYARPDPRPTPSLSLAIVPHQGPIRARCMPTGSSRRHIDTGSRAPGKHFAAGRANARQTIGTRRTHRRCPPTGARKTLEGDREVWVCYPRGVESSKGAGARMPPCPRCSGVAAKEDGRGGATRRYRGRPCRRTCIARTGRPFAGHRWPREVTVTAVRWYLRYRRSAADPGRSPGGDAARRAPVVRRDIRARRRAVVSWLPSPSGLHFLAIPGDECQEYAADGDGSQDRHSRWRATSRWCAAAWRGARESPDARRCARTRCTSGW